MPGHARRTRWRLRPARWRPGRRRDQTPQASAEGTIVLKVDADKLPRPRPSGPAFFLTTVSVVVSDQDIRLVTRKASQPVQLSILDS